MNDTEGGREEARKRKCGSVGNRAAYRETAAIERARLFLSQKPQKARRQERPKETRGERRQDVLEKRGRQSLAGKTWSLM